MADVIMYCGQCKEQTEHTHLAGRTCACAVCGELSQAKQVKRILANIEERKAESIAAVSKAQGKVVDAELEAVAQLPYSERGFREPSGKQRPKSKGETTMKKLTDENIADIKRRKAAGEKPAALAEEFGVNRCSIYAALYRGEGKKEKKAKASGKARPANSAEAGDALEPAPTISAGNPLKDAIAIAVSGHLANIDQRIRAIVREEIQEMLK